MPRKATATLGGEKRYPLNMRTTKRVRERLENAALQSGRSLVQEVENRLETSFQYESVFATLGGKGSLDILRPLLFFFGILEAKGINYSWRSDKKIAEELRRALLFIVESALSKKTLSRETQREMLGPRGFDRPAGDASETYPHEGAILRTALMAAQALDLAEGNSAEMSSASAR